jgi:alkylation response protein AidB-like acyl-CoA dehydrogenase
LNGVKRYVFDGDDAATAFICAARTDTGTVTLALVDRNAPGVTVKPILGFMIGTAEVHFSNVAVEPKHHRRLGLWMGHSPGSTAESSTDCLRVQSRRVSGDF